MFESPRKGRTFTNTSIVLPSGSGTSLAKLCRRSKEGDRLTSAPLGEAKKYEKDVKLYWNIYQVKVFEQWSCYLMDGSNANINHPLSEAVVPTKPKIP
ncbi:hypothetical protein QJS10_CPA10g02061 [Acorus calamus]|uniref:Uncharacterized protein n=1 Tax=Acorus calamus TaxID=4465 RepID=A0AAV9DVA1_ACOCL|nr:hypothetical protein QJS10_CPA10g02061 [Acorus calamus]